MTRTFLRQQECLGKDPWKLVITAILQRRALRKQVEHVVAKLFAMYPGPEYLCRAREVDVEAIVRPCGLYRTKVRQLMRFSSFYVSNGWEELTELPGVCEFIADAVAEALNA